MEKELDFSVAMLSRHRHVVMRCVEIMVVEMLLVPNIYIHSPIGQQQTTGFCDTKKGVMFSANSYHQDKLICHGKGMIFTKLSRIFNIYTSTLPIHYHVVFLQ